MKRRAMREYWDARADEDALFFVDNRLRYGASDLDRFWSGGREDLDRILKLLGTKLAPDDEIVEIGCGVGRITRVLAERGHSVRALDVSQRMLELARSHNPKAENVEWLLGDGESLAPISDASADVCFSHVVFQHIPDPEITLNYVREMGRVLRSRGWAGFQVSNSPDLHEPLPLGRRLRGEILALLGRGPRGQRDPSWRGSAIDLEQLQAVADAAELETDRIVGAGTQWCLVLLRKR